MQGNEHETNIMEQRDANKYDLYNKQYGQGKSKIGEIGSSIF